LQLPALPNSTATPVEATLENLPQLIGRGQFHTAAIAAAKILTGLSSTENPASIFNLLYVRFACLTLIHETKTAAAESKILGDLSSPFYRDSITNDHIVPWDLRVLAVRLQALGFSEWRRGIMAYYLLAHEARQETTAALERDHIAESRLWRARLHDLGVRVASSLVEMGDFEAAVRHLKTLENDPTITSSQRHRLTMMKTLVWLRVGDLASAERSLAEKEDDDGSAFPDDAQELSQADRDVSNRILHALLTTCKGDFEAASEEWRALNEEHPDDALIKQNLAVVLLYTGDMSTARQLLEDTANSETVPSFQSLLFNLATVYELSTENSQGLKTQLMSRIATMAEKAGRGSEIAVVEFKL
jgi:thioredoxin-like negative regulator of GroEL